MINPSDFVPLLLFLIIFFMAFSFLEMVIVFVINHLIRKHWKIVVDKLLKTIVYRKTLMRILSAGSLAVIFALVIAFTPLMDILVGGKDIVRILALILVIEMAAVYFFSGRSILIVIERRIHLYIFILFSFLSYTAIMMAASEGYAIYETSVKKTIVAPIVESIEENYEQEVENSLMALVREKAKAGKCPYYDYADSETTGGITQFIFVKEDPALKEERINAADIRGAGEPLAGKRCIHETTFILTPEGKWYQVLEQGY